jgi:hypothetical protein
MDDPEEAAAVATDYLKMFGLVAVGYMWALMAQKSCAEMAKNDKTKNIYYLNKIKTSHFYMHKLLPESASLFLRIAAGKDTIAQFDVDDF